MNPRNLLIILLALAFGAAACGSDGEATVEAAPLIVVDGTEAPDAEPPDADASVDEPDADAAEPSETEVSTTSTTSTGATTTLDTTTSTDDEQGQSATSTSSASPPTTATTTTLDTTTSTTTTLAPTTSTTTTTTTTTAPQTTTISQDEAADRMTNAVGQTLPASCAVAGQTLTVRMSSSSADGSGSADVVIEGFDGAGSYAASGTATLALAGRAPRAIPISGQATVDDLGSGTLATSARGRAFDLFWTC